MPKISRKPNSPRTKPPALVAIATAQDVVAEPPPSGEDVLPSSEAELSSRLAGLEKDHAEVTSQIQGFRRRLRDGQIKACDTHSALDPAEIKFCKDNIASLHARLTSIQGEIGRVGKALRTARASAPTASKVLSARKTITNRDGEARLVPRRDSAHHSPLIMECFLRLTEESLDAELFNRLMRDSIALAKDVRKMGLDAAESEALKNKKAPRGGVRD
jgi:hypothetical protein